MEHVVRPGETLSGIAHAHGVELEQLLELNRSIKDPDVVLVRWNRTSVWRAPTQLQGAKYSQAFEPSLRTGRGRDPPASPGPSRREHKHLQGTLSAAAESVAVARHAQSPAERRAVLGANVVHRAGGATGSGAAGRATAHLPHVADAEALVRPHRTHLSLLSSTFSSSERQTGRAHRCRYTAAYVRRIAERQEAAQTAVDALPSPTHGAFSAWRALEPLRVLARAAGAAYGLAAHITDAADFAYVSDGDTLWDHAEEAGLSIRELQRGNRLRRANERESLRLIFREALLVELLSERMRPINAPSMPPVAAGLTSSGRAASSATLQPRPRGR